MGVLDWSTTAADNDDADSAINWLENQAPSTVNNSARAMMAELAKWTKDNNGTLAATGSSNAFILTTNNSYSSLVDGTTVNVEVNHTIDGAATINVDGTGAVAIIKDADTALVTGDLQSGSRYHLTYDATSVKWRVMNPRVFGHIADGTVLAATDQNNLFTASQTVQRAGTATFTVNDTGGAAGVMSAETNDVTYGSSTNHPVNIQVNGTDEWIAQTNGGFKAAGLADASANGIINAVGYEVSGVSILFQTKFTSSEQAATPGGTLTLAHSLGAVPEFYQVYAICKITEGNYSVGNTVLLNNGQSNSSSFGVQMYADSTNINAVVGTQRFALMLNASTGAAFTPTTANWNLIFKAFV